jgi:hypothetical protein
MSEFSRKLDYHNGEAILKIYRRAFPSERAYCIRQIDAWKFSEEHNLDFTACVMQRVKLVADVASQHQANQQSAIQHQHSAQMDRDKLAANIANEHDRNQIAASKTAGEPRPGHTMPGLQSDNTNPGVGNPV